MSKSVLGIVLNVAAIGLMFIPGVGTALGLGAKLLGGALTVAQAIGAGLMLASSVLLGPAKPKMPQARPTDRLYATLVPTTPRKWVFGSTALATDIRYQTFTGTDQEYYWQVICCASHEAQSIDEIWLDNEKAWSAGFGVFGRYIGYLTVTTRTLGASGNGVAIDSTWTASCTLTGCAYVVLKFKLTGNSDNAQSPFAGGVTNRVTIRGLGAKTYDPRLDSTVAGGSGTMRANDQATWAWNGSASRNPALQLLFFLLGWRINGKLALGMGLPAARIDLASFITAANLCDESVTLNGGGAEPRYRCDGAIGENEDRRAVIEALCASMNATLRDAGGKLALDVIHNDLASPVASFTEADILDGGKWVQTPPLSQSFNIVRGQRIDPSDQALYQPVDYPEVSLASPDGIDRIDTADYDFVQSNGQAQRLAKQRLQRNQYQGRYSFTGGERWWQVSIGDIVSLSHQSYGWSNKLFRMAEQAIDETGPVKITLLEENAAIYQWDNNEAAPVVAGTPTIYDPLNAPVLAGLTTALGKPDVNPIGDSNRVLFSLMERKTQGYAVLFNPNILSVNLGVSTVLQPGRRFIIASANWTAANQSFSIGTDLTEFPIPVRPGERIAIAARLAIDIAGSTGQTWLLATGFVDSNGAQIAGSEIALASGTDNPGGGAFGDFVTTPPTAYGAYLNFYVENHSSGAAYAALYMGEPMVCSASSTQTAFPAFAPGPSNLTIDSATSVIIDPPADVVIYADVGGVVKSGELPRDIGLTASIGTANVTTQGAWSMTATGGVTATIGAANGILTITALSVAEAQVPVSFTYNGVTRSVNTHIVRKDDPPTNSGGGGGSGTSASTTTLFATTGTAYDAAAASSTLTAQAGPAGQVALTAPVSFKRTPGTAAGETGAAGKWQWRVVGGAFADVATEMTGGTAQTRANPGDPTVNIGGLLSVDQTKAGLTPGTAYEFRFLWRRIDVSGTANNIYRTTGTLTATGS